MEKWYTIKKDDETYRRLIPLMNKIQENQIYRRAENLMWARLYGSVDIMGLTPTTYSRPNPISQGVRPKFNIVASCIDTLAAKISKNRPRPFFLTDGGNWTLQTKAKKLQKFIDGQFFETKTYQQTDKAFIDAGTFGTGLCKVFSAEGKIIVERVIPDEIIVDDAEAVHNNPRNLYQKKLVDRDMLINLFPEYKAQILDLPKPADEFGFYNVTDADYVEVMEAWHLPSGKSTNDGRHVISTRNCDLVFEEYNRTHFPFAKLTFRDRLAGWYGQGVAEILMGVQISINRILRNNDVSQYLHSAAAWLVEEGSGIVSAHLNNDIGHIVKYRGVPPELKVFSSVNPEMYAQIREHMQRAYEEVGISQLSAASQKPAGLNSGKALREYNDIESERFVKLGQKWEQFHLDIASLMIEEAKVISEQDPKFSVLAKDGNFIERINWKDVKMDEDKYQLQVFPTSQLPRAPYARMQYVTEMQNAGYIDPETAQELLDMPDIEQFANLSFAGRRVIRDSVQKMMESNEFIPPEPFQDLSYTLSYAQMYYNYAKLHGADELKLEMLRRYMEQANALIQLSLPPEPMAPPSEPPLAQGVGGQGGDVLMPEAVPMM